MKIAVIGAGPAGMMAAVHAAPGADVTVFEKNEKVGKKLYITGKGRCNVTNDCTPFEFSENVVGGAKFLMSAVNAFPPRRTMEFFESRGVKLKTERGRRVFPLSDKSSDIIAALCGAAEEAGVKIVFENVDDIEVNGGGFTVYAGKKTEKFDKLIVACGGLSYPATGSTGDGYRFAKKAGHSITRLRPALVPLVLRENTYGLRGLSLKNVRATLSTAGKNFSLFGEMIFTDKGVSGPIILSLSSLAGEYGVENSVLSLDLKPALSFETLDKRLVSDFEKYKNKQFKNSLSDLLPSSIIGCVIEKSGISPDKQTNSVTKAERHGLVRLLKNLTFEVVGTEDIQTGIVTAGGVSLDEINPKTMESKLVKGLYFAGETIDADALTGGFNLQIAFATGYVAGKHAGEDI